MGGPLVTVMMEVGMCMWEGAGFRGIKEKFLCLT